MSLDNKLLFAGMVIEAAILALLLYRRVWRTLPFFFSYILWGLIGDGFNYSAQRHYAGLTSENYLRFYFVVTLLDSTLQFCVLVELGWSVLRPLRPALSKRALLLVALVILATGALIWPFAGGAQGLAKYGAAWANLVHFQQTTSILRVLFFAVLAGASQFLSIGWRDRELQVATGLGFYAMVNLAIDILREHQAMGPRYSVMNRVVAASYFCSLLYWGYSFSQKEAARRQFTPQMQSFLLAVAGTARSARIDLTKDRSVHHRDPRD